MVQYTLQEAWALHNRGEYARAALVCDQILRFDPDNAAVLGCRAMSNWSRRENIDGVLADGMRCVELAPDVPAHRHNLATILASIGRLDEAQSAFRAALSLDPRNTQAFYSLAQNTRYREEDDAVRRMRRLCDDDQLPAQLREFACFGLAKIYDDLGRYEEAMRFAQEANQLGARAYDLDADKARLADLRSLAESGLFPRKQGSDFKSKAPVFVIGMPRSGTTLVESILARHPDVFAAGELDLVPQVEGLILRALRTQGARNSGPDFALLDIAPGQFRNWANAVLEAVWKLAGAQRPMFIDKLPDNSIRLGLIAKMFPEARIIHVRRNPLDTGLSNFFMRFHSGHGYSNRLDMIGTRSRIVADTVQTWKRTSGLQIMDVRYEDLVAQSEPEVRRILDFVGLEFYEKCLRPHRGDRGVMTASQWQVRQPIYQSSVARWQHYERWLDPMIEAIGGWAWIDRYTEDAAA